MPSILLSPRDIRRFWQKVGKTEDCWNWLEQRSTTGHGLFWVNSAHSYLGAHRVSYTLAAGPIPDGLWVLHRCHNAACVNPSDLYLGTAKDNARDRVERIRRGIAVILPARRPPPSTEQRFWAKVDKTDGCWLWTAGKMHGRGTFHPTKGRIVIAHRFSYELAHGPIPPGLFVLHTCDVPRCVRPDHLWLGTHDDNMADMRAKGRSTKGRPRPSVRGDLSPPRRHPERGASGDRNAMRKYPHLVKRGEAKPTAKLTDAQVREIRRRYDAGGISIAKLARDYPVAWTNVRMIVRRLAWKHVS